jgi:hypothetical protein
MMSGAAPPPGLPAREFAQGDTPVAAAKLHLLQLEPIREKLGPRWGRLSDLVHALFEKALKRAQGPGDHFVAMGELSYVVTFHGLSPEEAGLACAAVANEVCELLFGDGYDGIAVRSLVGFLPPGVCLSPLEAGSVEAHLERSGTETLTRRAPVPVAVRMPGEALVAAHRLMRDLNRGLAFFPLWDMTGPKSSAMLLLPHTAGKAGTPLRRVMAGTDEQEVTAAEIALLAAAGEYAVRVQRLHKVCAIGVGVSYETLSCFNSRIRYIGALKALPSACPFLLKIDQVPDGTPLGRLAEMIAMLNLPNLRILVEFANGAAIPEIDLRLNANGIGAILPEHCSAEAAAAIAQKLVKRAVQQKAFAFIGGLTHDDLIGAVRGASVRFGMGSALDDRLYFTGLESVPDFPLSPMEHPVREDGIAFA